VRISRSLCGMPDQLLKKDQVIVRCCLPLAWQLLRERGGAAQAASGFYNKPGETAKKLSAGVALALSFGFGRQLGGGTNRPSRFAP